MKQYIVDAFTDRPFAGNPAAVCVLEQWLPDELMQQIAIENNLSETAFTVPSGDDWNLRWFTPGGEIDLCGHATLATAYTLLRFFRPDDAEVRFHTLSGLLTVRREGDLLCMDFPTFPLEPIPVTDGMTAAIGVQPVEACRNADLLLVLENEDQVRGIVPDQRAIDALDFVCIVVTAPGKEHDCVSRVFCPQLSIAEDPVTGRAHCSITPYWSRRLNKRDLHAYQASARGGELFCTDAGERTIIRGKATLFATAELHI